MNVKKGTITTDRFLIPYQVYGQGEQFMVCVNAVQQTMAAWRSVIGYFAERYRLLLFDFPGQGRGRILSGGGEKDEILDVADINAAAARISRCQIKIVSGVGHFLHNEDRGVLPIYGHFLATASRSRSKYRDRKCIARASAV